MNAPGPNHLQVVLSRIALGIYVLLFFLEFVLNILKLNLPLAFRGDTSNRVHPNFFYQFQVCQDGTYQVLEGYEKPLTTSSNHVIHRGLKQSNLIAVVASGNMISVYVNQQVIDYGPGDDHITHGFIGVGAIDKKNSTEVLYNHARVWTA